MSTSPDDLITAQEAAALLKCSLKTLYRLRKSGELSFTRPSWGSVRYRRGDVEALRKDQPCPEGLHQLAPDTVMGGEYCTVCKAHFSTVDLYKGH